MCVYMCGGWNGFGEEAGLVGGYSVLMGGRGVCLRPDGTPLASTGRSRGMLGLRGLWLCPHVISPPQGDPGLLDLLLGRQETAS